MPTAPGCRDAHAISALTANRRARGRRREGTILTNAHVVTNVAEGSGDSVKGAEKLYVDGDRVPATIGWDLFSDAPPSVDAAATR
jgi:hypothetical protein